MTLDRNGYVEVDGSSIALGEEGRGEPLIVLVHGAGGHRHWWHRVVPGLAPHHRVVALDLSGHGDSGWRRHYGPRVFAADVLGVVAAKPPGPVVLVGHSMGGLAATVAAARNPIQASALVLLDTIFRPEERRRNRVWPVSPTRMYASAEEARARFRLVPRQPPLADEVMSPVLFHAVRETPSGWTWKFDPKARLVFEDDYVDAQLARVACPVTYAYGTEGGLRNLDAAEEVRRHHPGAHVVAVEGGHHHLPLDSPDACVEIILTAALGAVPHPPDQ